MRSESYMTFIKKKRQAQLDGTSKLDKRSRMKLLWSGLLILSLLVLSACGQSSNNSAKIVEGKVNVVTTFYPVYAFTAAIGGEDANVINLLPTGVEPHDWTPKSQDIVNTSKAQLFLYNGAGLEGWVP